MNEAQAAAAYAHKKYGLPPLADGRLASHSSVRSKTRRQIEDGTEDWLAGHAAALSWTPIVPGVVPDLPRRTENAMLSIPVLVTNPNAPGGADLGWYNYENDSWYLCGMVKRTPTHYFTGFIGNLPGKEGDNGK